MPLATAKAPRGKEKEQVIVVEGTVEEALPSAMFSVRLDAVDHVVIAYVSGRMRRHRVRILPGEGSV